MGKNKLKKFAEMEQFSHVFQLSFNDIMKGASFSLKGKWSSDYFKNSNPIVLELGCGKGEYAVGLARTNHEKNFIGIDLKGARIWTGAKTVEEERLENVAFVRTAISAINHFFAPGEVSEIWITFPDPQMKKASKRLTSTDFLTLYRQVLKPEGLIHLKTDSNFLFTYTCALVAKSHLPVVIQKSDIYDGELVNPDLAIKTYYERQWLARGIAINYIQFQLPQEGELLEPEIEIPYDEYRSFGRQKRSELELGQ